MAVVDLVNEELSPEGFAEGEAILKLAYGRDYPAEKFELLFGMCTEDHWSEKRFFDTLRWVVKNNPYPDWKIADFFKAPLLKLYPRSWYYEQCHNKIKTKQYKVGEHLLYALASDDIPLPEYVTEPPAFVAPASPEGTPEERERILRELKNHKPEERGPYSMATPLGKIVEGLTDE